MGGGGGGGGPCLNCSFAPGIEMLEFMVGAACWRIQVRGVCSQRPRTPRTFSAMSSFSTLTTPSVGEASITCPPPPPGRIKIFHCLRGSQEDARAAEENVCKSRHPASTFQKYASTLSSHPDGGRRARAQKLRPHTEPMRSFIPFYLLEDTTNSKYLNKQ